MNRKDAERVVDFLERMIRAAQNQSGELFANIKADFIKTAEGTPGTGACICKHPPDWWRRNDGMDDQRLGGYSMVFDHRCEKHGEKAQPALWGRNRTLELTVTQAVWDSLGVEHK